MEDKHETPEGCAAIFHVKVRKNMDIEIWGDAINCALYNLINSAISKAINENITEADKMSMIETLLKENKWAMQGESSTVILNQAVKDAKRKCRKRTTKKKLPTIPPPVGYRSPYLPPKTREEYIRDQLKAQRQRRRENGQ